MSQSIPNLLASFIFGVFYTVASLATLPITLISNRMSNSDENEEIDAYYDEDYWTDEEGFSYHHSEPDPRYDEKSVAASIDPESVNPQDGCFLFNGRIPPEIRTMILSFALLEEDVEGEYGEQGEETHYCRPGYTRDRVLRTDLLRTCKAVYLETYKLPAALNEHRFWLDRGPPGHTNYLYKMNKDTLESVRKLHFWVQMFNLETAFQNVLETRGLVNVEHLTITFRRGDWWFWEREEKLRIHPSGANLDYAAMKSAWSVEDQCGGMHTHYQVCTAGMDESQKAAYRHRVVAEGSNFDNANPWGFSLSYQTRFSEFNEDSWGAQFQRFPKLKRLDIQFETAAYNKDQLDDIVAHSLKWKFPFMKGKVLGNAAVTATEKWIGPVVLRASGAYPAEMPKGVTYDDMEIRTVTWVPTSLEDDERGEPSRSSKSPGVALI